MPVAAGRPMSAAASPETAESSHRPPDAARLPTATGRRPKIVHTRRKDTRSRFDPGNSSATSPVLDRLSNSTNTGLLRLNHVLVWADRDC